MTGIEKLEIEFEEELRDAYHEAKTKCGYNAMRFVRMLAQHGGVETARRLLDTGSKAQTGLTTLWQCQRTDLSVEAKVLIPKYKALFSETLRRAAQKRLDALKQ